MTTTAVAAGDPGDEDDSGEIVFEAGPDESGKKLSIAEQAARNLNIVSDRARGLSVAHVAGKYGLSTRRVKSICAEYRKSNPTLRHHDPIEVVDQLLEGYQGAMHELALISATTPQDAVRVGAINSRMGALRAITELLQAVGALPHDLGTLRVEMDARVTAERVIAVLDRFDLDDDVVEAMAEALSGSAGELPAGPQDIDGTASEL